MVHTEEDAINKLPINNKKPIYVNMLVIRNNNLNNCIINSKPCSNCQSKIIKAKEKGYIISNIYYSNDDGNIEKFKIEQLNDKQLFPKRYSRCWNN